MSEEATDGFDRTLRRSHSDVSLRQTEPEFDPWSASAHPDRITQHRLQSPRLRRLQCDHIQFAVACEAPGRVEIGIIPADEERHSDARRIRLRHQQFPGEERTVRQAATPRNDGANTAARGLQPALQLAKVLAPHSPPHERGLCHLPEIRLQPCHRRVTGLRGYEFEIGIRSETEQRIAGALPRMTTAWLRGDASEPFHEVHTLPQFRGTDQEMVRLELHLDRYSRYAESRHG